jgi:glycosyltransferase involved in cell wall biosynthesis
MRGDGRVRVLFCIPRLVGGGAERQLSQLLPRLVERGIGVSLFSRLTRNEVASLEAAGIACYPIRAAGNHDPRLLGELAVAARHSRAAIIHSWLTQMDVLGGAVALTTGRSWVLSERSSTDGYGAGWKDRLRRLLGRFADIVVANSEAGLDAWPGHPRRAIIANGLDLERISDAGAAAWPIRRPLIVAMARLEAHKGVGSVLNAVARLRGKYPDLMLVILGQGPLEAELRALAAALGIEDNVIFAGFRPDAWSWLKAACLFVSASSVEGQPNAVMEAAAAGIPQVLSDIVMHRDTVGDGGALFFEPSPEAMAAAIAELLENPARGRAIVASARSSVADFSVERAADLHAVLYRRTASGSPMPEAGRGASCSSAA